MSCREVLLSLISGYDLGLCVPEEHNQPSYVLRTFLLEARVQYWGWLKGNIPPTPGAK